MAFSRETALDYLRRAHSQKRLGHAYLISGPPGSGKRALAADITSLVNGTKPADVFSARAREVFVAEPESKSRRIVVDQVRGLEHALLPLLPRLIGCSRKQPTLFSRRWKNHRQIRSCYC
jgi:DNA polymerase-3 subunit delta'